MDRERGLRDLSAGDSRHDALREIGNIGSGHVLTALSRMTGKGFAVSAPEAEFLDYTELPAKIEGAEEVRAGVVLELSGDLCGFFMFVADWPLVNAILVSLGVGGTDGKTLELDSMQRSALLEVGNIIANSYVTAICELTGLSMSSSVPAMAVDMLGALLSLPAPHFALEESRMIYVRSAFRINDEDFSGNIILLPDHQSLVKLMANIGID